MSSGEITPPAKGAYQNSKQDMTNGEVVHQTSNGTEMNNNAESPAHTLGRKELLRKLFVEFFKISLFVIGGGYAIIIAADDVFGRKLKWIDEGELLAQLPILQSVPGLIAGNSAIYVGRKMAGTLGAFVSLVGIALPSVIILTAVGMGFKWLPMDNVYVNGALLGLRSALCGIVLAAIIKSWKKSVKGAYGYIAVLGICIAIIVFKKNPVLLLISSMIFGAVYKGFIEQTPASTPEEKEGTAV